MERNIITTDIISEEKQFEKNLRPKYLDEYIGQEKIKSNIKIYIDAAKLRFLGNPNKQSSADN